VHAGDRETEVHDINSIVSVYETPVDGVGGVNELRNAGFEMTNLSTVAREHQNDEHVIGYCNPGSGGTKYWGKVAAFWGELSTLLTGVGFLLLPGVGPVLMAGPVVGAVVAGLEGAGANRSFGALGAAFRNLGIPREAILRYESEVSGGRFLLIAHGTAGELIHAKEVLHKTRPAELNLHFAEEMAQAGRKA